MTTATVMACERCHSAMPPCRCQGPNPKLDPRMANQELLSDLFNMVYYVLRNGRGEVSTTYFIDAENVREVVESALKKIEIEALKALRNENHRLSESTPHGPTLSEQPWLPCWRGRPPIGREE